MKPLAASTVALALVAALAAPSPAGAVVPPKSCGKIEVRGKRHLIKADGVRCRAAKRHGRDFLRTGRDPARWNCKRYPRTSSFSFQCWKGVRVIYGIRR